MKKLFMFLAVAGLATFGASCSKSDDNGGGDEKNEKQLELTASNKEIKVGDSVTFTVKVDGKVETGAELLSGKDKISLTHKFDKAGDFTIVARKNGFKESASVTIKVTDKDTPPEEGQLTLIATPSTVKVGESVMFVVKDGSSIITDATITQVGGAAVTGGTWTATAEGVVKFKATKAGAKDSAEVSVTVEKAAVVPTGNYTKLNGEYNEITNLTRVFINGVKGADGKFMPFIYEEEGETFSIVTYELGSIDEEASVYITRTSTTFITNQTIGQNYMFPANVGEDSFIINSAIADFDAGAFVPFNLATDLIDVSIADSTTEFLLTMHIENETNGIKFDGTMGGSYYWREVGPDGMQLKNAAKAKVSADFIEKAIFGGKKSVK